MQTQHAQGLSSVAAPSSILFCPVRLSSPVGIVLGYRLDAVLVVAALVPALPLPPPSSLPPNLSVLGRAVGPSEEHLASNSLSLSHTDSHTDSDLVLFFSAPPNTLPRLLAHSLPAAPLLVYYSPPNRARHHFLSLKPLPINIALAPSSHSPSSDESLATAIDYINTLDDLNPILSPPPPPLSSLSTFSSTFSFTYRRTNPPPSSPRRLLSKASLILRAFLLTLADISHFLFAYKFPFLSLALNDLSAAVQQLDVRLEQLSALPRQWHIISHHPHIPTSRAHYVSLHSTLWWFAQDTIVGSAIGSLLCERADVIARLVSYLLRRYAIDGFRTILLWLNDWPVGLKLNYHLASHFCNAALVFTATWDRVCISRVLLPYLPTFIYFAGISSYAGITFFLAFASDFISIATLHLYILYSIATKLFSVHLSLIYTLFNIFNGKRYNSNKNRSEPHDYSLETLLCGSILFTLAIFLFPTVLAYYLAFASSRLGIIALHASFEAILVCFNHFPLFALLLRLKEPARLPGGIRFESLDIHHHTYSTLTRESSPLVVVKLTNMPIKPYDILVQYFNILASLSSHYSPIYLFRNVLTGKHISPIPRVRLRHVAALYRDSTPLKTRLQHYFSSSSTKQTPKGNKNNKKNKTT